MSNLTSILANSVIPETRSLNNSQTLIASGNIFNSGGFTAATGTEETLKAFGNYRPSSVPEKFTNGELILRASQFPTARYIRPANIKAIYFAGKGLLPQSELPAYVAIQDERYIIANRNEDINPNGFIRIGMILDVDNRVSYLYKGSIGYLHDAAETYPTAKNPPPLIGQAGAVVSKPDEVRSTPAQEKGRKGKVLIQQDIADGVIGITGTEAASAANKPGAPGANTRAAVPDTPVLKLSEKFDPAANFFRIIYVDTGNNVKSFVFTFLPARETKIGNWNVPEARTGVPIQTKMRHKMQVVPGAGPIVQTIGINGTTVTLVGALLGNEVIAEDFATGGPNSRPIYASANKVQGTNTYAEGAYPGALPRGAYDKAVELQRRLVYPGRPVTIEIKPSSTQATFQMKADGSTNKIGDFIRMTGVITAIRLQHAHSDRCYYALDLFVTDYPEAPAAKPNTNAVLQASKSIEQVRASNYTAPADYSELPAVAKAVQELAAANKKKPADPKAVAKLTQNLQEALRTAAKAKGSDALAAKLLADKYAKELKVKTDANSIIERRKKTEAGLTKKQQADLQDLLENARPERRQEIIKNYLDRVGPKASLDTRLGIDEGVDYAEQLANANPQAASESSAIAADYLATTSTNQAPVGLSIASISEQLTNNIQAAANSDNVLSAISNATAGTLRPAQQKAALAQIAARTDLDPLQLTYLTDAISRYPA